MKSPKDPLIRSGRNSAFYPIVMGLRLARAQNPEPGARPLDYNG